MNFCGKNSDTRRIRPDKESVFEQKNDYGSLFNKNYLILHQDYVSR